MRRTDGWEEKERKATYHDTRLYLINYIMANNTWNAQAYGFGPFDWLRETKQKSLPIDFNFEETRCLEDAYRQSTKEWTIFFFIYHIFSVNIIVLPPKSRRCGLVSKTVI